MNNIAILLKNSNLIENFKQRNVPILRDENEKKFNQILAMNILEKILKIFSLTILRQKFHEIDEILNNWSKK